MIALIIICMIVYAACVTALNLWLWREVKRGECGQEVLERSLIRTCGVTVIYFTASVIQLLCCIHG